MAQLLLLHLLAAALAPWLAKVLRTKAFPVLALAPAVSFGWLVSVSGDVRAGNLPTQRISWVPGLGLDLDFRVTTLSWVLGLLVTGVGALVLLYCTWYFTDRDPTLWRFTSVFTAFAGAMLGLVLTDNLLVLYVFWELTTVFSYLLIGHNPASSTNRRAAMQALIVTTFGGLAMLIGIIALGVHHTYSISALLADPPPLDAVTVAAVVLLLVGALSKSALVPFHFWLPGAMAAPTPVSAYLHAAAMVKAGIYLVALLAPVFAGAPAWHALTVGLGLFTMLVGGWRALRQHDIKLLLAYGTVSQLGFIVAIAGLGTKASALSALALVIAHALFKSTLFLTVGVVDKCTGTRDLRELSGVGRRLLPVSRAGDARRPRRWPASCRSRASWPRRARSSRCGRTSRPPRRCPRRGAGSRSSASSPGRRSRSPTRRASSGAPSRRKPGVAPDAGQGRPPRLRPRAGAARRGQPARSACSRPSSRRGCCRMPCRSPPAPSRSRSRCGTASPCRCCSRSCRSAVGARALRPARPRRAGPVRRPGRSSTASAASRATLRWVDRGAVETTAVTQRGSLPIYLAGILIVFVALPGLAAVTRGTLPQVRLWDNPGQAVVGVVVVAAAVLVLVTRRRLTAVMLVGATGYGVSLLFILHGAPDLAITQMLVETVVARRLRPRAAPPADEVHPPPALALAHVAHRARSGRRRVRRRHRARRVGGPQRRAGVGRVPHGGLRVRPRQEHRQRHARRHPRLGHPRRGVGARGRRDRHRQPDLRAHPQHAAVARDVQGRCRRATPAAARGCTAGGRCARRSARSSSRS